MEGRPAGPALAVGEGHGTQGVGDGLGHLGRVAVSGQLGVRVAVGRVDGRHHSSSNFGSGLIIGEGGGDGIVRLLGGVSIAVEAEGPVVVAKAMLRGPVAWRFLIWFVPASRSQVMLPTQAGGFTRLVAPPSQNPVDGKLEGDLQRVEVSCRGEGPGILEGQYLRVVPVEACVLEGLPGLVGGLGEVGQERCRDPLVDVGRRFAGRHVDGQLIDHRFERICCYRCEGGVVGACHGAVHRSRGRMVRKLQVHRSGRALAVDLDLEGVEGGLAGLADQAQGQKRQVLGTVLVRFWQMIDFGVTVGYDNNMKVSRNPACFARCAFVFLISSVFVGLGEQRCTACSALPWPKPRNTRM